MPNIQLKNQLTGEQDVLLSLFCSGKHLDMELFVTNWEKEGKKKSQCHSYQGATQQLWSQESMCVNLPGRDGIKLVWFVFLRIFWAVSLSGAREEKQKFLVWHGVQSKDLQCGPSHVHQQCGGVVVISSLQGYGMSFPPACSLTSGLPNDCTHCMNS